MERPQRELLALKDAYDCCHEMISFLGNVLVDPDDDIITKDIIADRKRYHAAFRYKVWYEKHIMI